MKQRLSRFIAFILYILIFVHSTGAQESTTLTFASAIALAEKNNPRLAGVEQRIAAEKGDALTEWWPENPNLAIEWEGVPRGQGLQQFEERRLAFSQEILFPTNLWWQRKRGHQKIAIAQSHFRQVQAEIRAQTIIAFAEFLAAREHQKLAQEQVQLAEEFLEKAEIRRQVGEAPAIETVRAQVEFSRVQNARLNAEHRLVTAKTALREVLGLTASQTIATSDSLTYHGTSLSSQDLQNTAVQNHPLLHESEARVRAANFQKKLAWGSFLPAIELAGFQQNLAGDADFYGAEIGFKIPLWFAFQQRGTIQHANATAQAEQHARREIRLRIEANIERAFSKFHITQNQVNLFDTSLLAQADEAYRIALRSYEEGEIGYLQVLESQRTLIEVRGDYIETLARYYNAIAELEKASATIILNTRSTE